MLSNKLTGLNKQILRRWLLVFFLALLIPTALLIQQSYTQLKWETFHQHQVMADELATRIDSQFLQLINAEQQRSFTDYSFLNVVGDPSASFFQRSPLSNYPISSEMPGLIGYFQVDSLGKLKTPLIPEEIEQANNYGVTDTELVERLALHNKIQSILSDNRLVQNEHTGGLELNKDKRQDNEGEDDAIFSSIGSDLSSSIKSSEAIVLEDEFQPSIQGQAAFDELKKSPAKKLKSKGKLGRLEDLKLEQNYKDEVAEQEVIEEKQQQAKSIESRARKEQSVLPEAIRELTTKYDADLNDQAEIAASPTIQTNVTPLRIYTFESEIDPFEFSQLDSGHFVLFRKVWLNEQRYIQGVLIEQQPFLEHIINTAFRNTALSTMSNLLVAYQGNVLQAFTEQATASYLSSTHELTGELLYQTRLSDPLSELQLLFSITQLPAGPGGTVIKWLALILACVLCIGFYLMYRLGVGQINLANQQQDFVSAVSHELKTPLTSIRMYGEILREGWASEDKKKSYYDFIFDESERLSRLINNVLLMAKLTRNKQQVDLKKITVAELMNGVQSKVSTQIDRAGFDLTLICEQAVKQFILNIDADWFSQIMINLVDNAIKFSVQAQSKKIELSCQQLSNGQVQFSVRDYGPGIAKQQMKKIFQLFYRSESELTRETVGTGIGLALVHQMIVGMNGQIDVVNSEPGAEFRVQFPVVK
ncbi:MAG: sensor histidine kinase [Methylophagaceae bacterium]